MTTAEELIDRASGLPIGAERRDALIEAADSRDPVLRGVALAMLAQQEPAFLDRADQALREARDSGHDVNWILVHLAEAYLPAGRADDASRAATAVDRAYFDGRDLHWRSVRMDEVHCAALLRTGRLREGVALADRICGELARRGDLDDLAPPVFLARAGLDLVDSSEEQAAAGCRVLRTLSDSIELDDWFPASLVTQIRKSLERCT